MNGAIICFGASRTPKLLKLGVEGLPVGADAGIAEAAVLQVCFSHILREAQDTDRQWASGIPESLKWPYSSVSLTQW